LAIGVVVTVLRASELITGKQHRHALREQKRRQDVADLPVAELDNFTIVSWTLGPAIPGSVARVAILVVFAVGLIVFVFVRNGVA
jgi:hypothetical protein